MNPIVNIEISKGLTLSLPVCQILHRDPPPRVVIAVPHDGFIQGDLFGYFEERNDPASDRQITHERDIHVWPIVNDIAISTKAKIAAVRLLVPRAYIDGNRPQPTRKKSNPLQTAYKDKRLRKAYLNYFGNIYALIEKSIAVHGKENVLFIDFHGHRAKIEFSKAHDIILGTRYRRTIKYGNVDRQFAEAMRKNEHSVFLPGRKPVNGTSDPLAGGYTTRHIARKFGINAMQIEIHPYCRTQQGQEAGKKMARDIGAFLAATYG